MKTWLFFALWGVPALSLWVPWFLLWGNTKRYRRDDFIERYPQFAWVRWYRFGFPICGAVCMTVVVLFIGLTRGRCNGAYAFPLITVIPILILNLVAITKGVIVFPRFWVRNLFWYAYGRDVRKLGRILLALNAIAAAALLFLVFDT